MRNKKGQMFTLFAIILLGLVFVSFEIYPEIYAKESVRTRVSTMNDFMFSVEQNLERQMYTTGFRIIFLAENEITLTGQPVDVDNFFNESFFNGTVNGEPHDFLLGATYDYLIDSLNEKGDKINVDITFENPKIVVTQEDPWNVKFGLVGNLTIVDKQGLAKWVRGEVISTYIPITNFEDPMFIMETNSLVPRTINRTVYSGDYTGGNLLSHVNNNYYEANPNAPSFLKRLEGDFSPDENGIESFVVRPDLEQQGLPSLDKSCVDYIYFSSENPSSQVVSGMPSWFKIDNAHCGLYNVSC